MHSQTDLLALLNTLPGYFAASSSGNGSNSTAAVSSPVLAPIRLVVVDSVAFHFRHDIADTKARSRLLISTATKLQSLAAANSVAVVTTNHVTTRVGGLLPVPPASAILAEAPPGTCQTVVQPHQWSAEGAADGVTATVASRYDTGSRTSVVPALGESWTRCVHTRVMLHWTTAAVAAAAAAGTETASVTNSSGAGPSFGQLSPPLRCATLLKSSSSALSSAAFVVNAQGVRDVPDPTKTSSSSSSSSTSSTAVAGHNHANATRDADTSGANKRPRV